MPLYNNILSSRKNAESGSGESSVNAGAQRPPSASMKLLQDHLLSKRRAHQQQSSQNKPSATIKKPSIAIDTKSKLTTNDLPLQQQQQIEWNPDDEEYDPMIPNSYEVVKAEYLKSERLRQANLANSATKKLHLPNLLDVLDRLDEDENRDDDNHHHHSSGAPEKNDNKRAKGTTIAPPPSLSSASSISSGPIGDRPEIDLKPSVAMNTEQLSAAKMNASSIAAKIMSKMGYKQGQGLGRDEQGISEPLEVEKSGPNLGKISAPVAQGGSHLEAKATRILLLQNMVGPGEVDGELESETKEECSKYGPVEKCLIYEIPNKKVPDEEAVRIFVEFRHAASAIKAANDLNGRYFGGRIVRASFYSVEKFNKFELGQQ